MNEIKIGKNTFKYERLPSKSVKYITIQIDPNKNIRILASNTIREEELRRIVQGKIRWIRDKLLKIDEIQKNIPRELTSGEGLLYKGKLLN